MPDLFPSKVGKKTSQLTYYD